jgi:exopolysaccharide biosynthesis polyprenyl glycosylphosphotransferase
MNSCLDKLLPGFAAKFNLAMDLAFLALGIGLFLGGAELLLLGWAIAVWIFATTVLRLYSPLTPRTLFDTMVLRIIAVAAVTASVFWIRNDFQPLATFAGFIFLTGSLFRLVLMRPILRLEQPTEDVLIIGTGVFARATAERLAELRKRVIGFVSLDDKEDTGLHCSLVLGNVDALLQIISDQPVHEVYIAGSILSQGQKVQHAVTICERIGMPFALPTHALTFERAHLISVVHGGDGYLHYCTHAAKPVQYALKRLFDIVASFTALAVLSPLFLGVAAIIKLTSPGPVFFIQERVGLHGSKFGLLKFRSMVTNAEALKDQLLAFNEQSGPVFKIANDPRITPFGRFIRKYSIDELPQLVNILRGDMTVVGPRPPVQKEVAQYKPWQRRRLSVRPGLTCYWQVSGRNNIGFDDWMQLDLQYVDNWDLVVDLRLILQTFPVVLLGKGAS